MNSQISQRSRQSGFTIVELLISMVLLGIMMTAILGTVTRTQKQYVQQRTSTRAHESLGMVEQTLTRLFRSARSDPKEVKLSGITPNPLNRASWDNVAIRSDFNPADGDVNDLMEDVQMHTASDTLYVRWKKNGAVTPMAYPVRSMLFEYYSSTGVKLNSVADVVGAARVKFTLSVPGKPGSPLVTRTTWVTIRN